MENIILNLDTITLYNFFNNKYLNRNLNYIEILKYIFINKNFNLSNIMINILKIY